MGEEGAKGEIPPLMATGSLAAFLRAPRGHGRPSLPPAKPFGGGKGARCRRGRGRDGDAGCGLSPKKEGDRRGRFKNLKKESGVDNFAKNGGFPPKSGFHYLPSCGRISFHRMEGNGGLSMAATIHELRTKPLRLRQDQAEQLRQALLPFEDEMPEQVRDLIGHIDRQTASKNKWTFVMLSPSQNAAVVGWLLKNSKRPQVAVHIWALCFEHLRTDTGEILIRREEIADAVNDTADHVSTIMGELEQVGAIIRRRERVAGMRGPGFVKYFMNPRVATNLSGKARDKAQEEAPPLLVLMQGGKLAQDIDR